MEFNFIRRGESQNLIQRTGLTQQPTLQHHVIEVMFPFMFVVRDIELLPVCVYIVYLVYPLASQGQPMQHPGVYMLIRTHEAQ